MTVAVCLKWVDQRPELDAAGVPTTVDERFAGISLADQAALEMAVRSGADVLAVTVGPPAADRCLRDAAACGATRLVRIDVSDSPDSAVVAALLASVIADARVVWCGDSSLDRGSGSVPAFLAAELNVAQLLGLVAADDDGETISATRRLDGGRRELLRTMGRAVCSVEGSVAQLRRAGLAATLAARSAIIEVVPSPANGRGHSTSAPVTSPYRPRPRAFAAPAGATALDRVRSLVISDSGSTGGESVTLMPPQAAARIVQALEDWGYLS